MTPEALADLHARCFHDRPWRAAEFDSLLKDPGILCLTRPEAFVMARLIAPEAEILTLATDPNARRQGHAEHLLHDLLNALAARGITDLFLEVASDNAAARALYEKSGFMQAGQRKGYYARADGSRVDALILRRTVNADEIAPPPEG